METDAQIRARHGVREAGVGVSTAILVWKSAPDHRGGVCHLMRDGDGQCWFSLAEAGGRYGSVTVDAVDLSRLEAALSTAKRGS